MNTPISSLTQAGVDIVSFYLVKKATSAMTKTNKPYIALTLADQTGEIEARIWGVDLTRYPGVEAGSVVKIAATTERYEDAIQLKVEDHRKFRAATELEAVPEDFYRRAERPAAEMLADLRDLLTENYNGPFNQCFLDLVDKYEQALASAPAAMKLHHPYLGGLLEHTISLCRSVIWASEKYGLNRTAMVGIAFLHDIGKIAELDPKRGNEYTRSGRLFGHIALGYQIARDAFDDAALTEEEQPLADAILHGILSHHGSLEHGSPVVPCTKEAIAFHYLDMLDSRMSMFDEAIRSDRAPGEFTEYMRHFGGALMKGKNAISAV